MKDKSGKGVTRRDFLKYSGAASAMGVLPAPVKWLAATKQDAELVVAFSGDPGHMDPGIEAGGIGWSTFLHMFEACAFRDKNCTPTPLLAEKWEVVSPTVLRYYLRKGVKFHNGEDFTAEAVKVTFERIIAPTSRSDSAIRLRPITEFKIHDPYKIDLITARPFKPLLGNATQAFMISPQALRELGDRFSTNPVGTGQFKFVEYRPGQHVVMEENPGYWGTKPNFKRLRIRFVPENGTRLASLEAGEVMMVNNVPPDQMARLKANPNIDVFVSPTSRVIFSTLRCDRKPFDDKRVRQAINYAIDKEAITKGLLGGIAPISKAPVSEKIFGAHPNLPPYKYDPDRAKKMLTEAGASGATFNFAAPNGRYLMDKQVGEAIAGFLSAVGLKVNFESLPWGNLVAEVTKFEKCRYDGYLWGWATFSGHPDWLMWDHFHSKSVKRTLYNNPEVDRLLDEGREAFENEKIKALYHKAQEIVWDECPWLFLYEQPDICASNKKLKWSVGRLDEFYLFNDASLEA